MNRRPLLISAALTAVALTAAAPGFAQAPYPARAVTIVVPFSPGGGTDIGARLVAQKLQQKWGQPVVVENRAGAAGLVGADAVAKAKPDGYTLMVGNVGTQSINPGLYKKKMPYDPDTAFAPVALIAELPFFILATPGLPARSVKELIAEGKARPETITYASSGSGGSPHLSAEVFQALSGAKFLHVPYKGGGPAMSDLMAGHVQLLFASVLESVQFVKTGKLKALAVTGRTRSPALPDVPTVAEAGLPDYQGGSWIGLLAPAGTPPAIVDRVAADVRAVLAVAETRDALVAQGAVPRALGPAEFKALIDADRQRYGRIIEQRGITAE